jgi:hypothetical protein
MKRTLYIIILPVLLIGLELSGSEPHFKAPFSMSGIANTKYPIAEFADWDGDGDDDMLLGQQANNGAVSLYTNSAGPGKTPVLQFTKFLQADGKQISLPSP